jgi:hypothetical protein
MLALWDREPCSRSPRSSSFNPGRQPEKSRTVLGLTASATGKHGQQAARGAQKPKLGVFHI